MAQDDTESFVGSVIRNWQAFMTSSKFMAVLTVAGILAFLGWQLQTSAPLWLALLLAVGGPIVVAIFLAGKDQHRERMKLVDAMKPKLEISRLPVRNAANEHRRIAVRNLSKTVIRFGARLEWINPPVKHEVPVRLQLTNTPIPHEEADILPDSEHLVDVFVDDPAGGRIGLLLATRDCVTNNRPFYIDRVRHEIRISAFTVTGSQVQGAVVSHPFSIIPHADGSMIFSDAG